MTCFRVVLSWLESEKKKAMANQLHHKFHCCPPGRDIKLQSGMEVKVKKKDLLLNELSCPCPTYLESFSSLSVLFNAIIVAWLFPLPLEFISVHRMLLATRRTQEGAGRMIPSGRQSLAFSSHWMRHGTYHSRGEMVGGYYIDWPHSRLREVYSLEGGRGPWWIGIYVNCTDWWDTSWTILGKIDLSEVGTWGRI